MHWTSVKSRSFTFLGPDLLGGTSTSCTLCVYVYMWDVQYIGIKIHSQTSMHVYTHISSKVACILGIIRPLGQEQNKNLIFEVLYVQVLLSSGICYFLPLPHFSPKVFDIFIISYARDLFSSTHKNSWVVLLSHTSNQQFTLNSKRTIPKLVTFLSSLATWNTG